MESAIISHSPTAAVPEALESLWQNIARIRVAMLTAIGVDGALASRPMMTCEIDPTGTLWFFVADDGALARSVSRDARVSVSYADPDDGWFASVSGTAQIVHDDAMARALWEPALSAWFHGGLAEPQLGLLRVAVRHAEYWKSSGKVGQLFAFAKAALLQTPPHHIAEHHTIDL